MTHPDIVQRLRDDEGELESRFAITRCSGEQQIANELRLIASETECGQRQMHLEIAAQIVEQGQFLHPSDFVFAIQADADAAEITTLRQQLAEAREALEPFVSGYEHTSIFLRSREKMHETGRSLYAEDVQRARGVVAKIDATLTPGGNHG